MNAVTKVGSAATGRTAVYGRLQPRKESVTQSPPEGFSRITPYLLYEDVDDVGSARRGDLGEALAGEALGARLRGRRDLHQIEAGFDCLVQGFAKRHHAFHLAPLVDQANGGCGDLIVDARPVSAGRQINGWSGYLALLAC